MVLVRFTLSLVGVVVVALAQSGVAAAHVTAVPTFVAAGDPETVTFVAPNEREAAMRGFMVTVPAGLSIVDTPASDGGWPGTVRGATASWSGCCVAPGSVASFSLGLEASAEPGAASLEVVQLYPDGEQVRWAVPLTVLPGETSSGSLFGALLVAAVGLLVTVGVVVFAWLRRTRSLQEG
jgi:uncharacterized protein YcnI